MNITRNQQEKQQKMHPIVEQHTIDWGYDHQRTQKRKKKITESSENENTTPQICGWDESNLKRELATIAYIIKLYRIQINNLALNVRVWGRKQTKPNISKWRKVVKIRVEISEMEIFKK